MACERFLNVVLDAQIITVGLKFSGMNTLKDKPTKNGFRESMKDGIKPVKQKYLQSTAIKFISTFIVDAQIYAKRFMNISSQQD